MCHVLGAGLGYGTQVVLARWMDTTAYGTYVYILSWITLLSMACGLGLPTAALRYIPTYRVQKAVGLLKGFITQSRRLVLSASAGMALAGSGLLYLLPPFTTDQAVLIALWVIPPLALLQLETQILRAHHRMVAAYGPLHVLRRLVVLGGVSALVLLSMSISPQVVLIISGAAAGLSLLVQRRATWTGRPNQWARHTPELRTRSWLAVALPLILGRGVLILINKMDILMIGGMLHLSPVGIYNAALQTAHAALFTGVAIDAVAAPKLARLHARADATALQQSVSRFAHWYFWPTLGAALGIALASEFILGLFGPSFHAARPALFILLIGFVVNAGLGPHLSLMRVADLQNVLIRIYGGCLMGNLVLNAAGIWAFGITGAAVATAATLVLAGLWMRRAVLTHLDVDTSLIYALRK